MREVEKVLDGAAEHAKAGGQYNAPGDVAAKRPAATLN
jgi:hypothetical protein